MTDYTDIALHLDMAKEQLDIALKSAKRSEVFADLIDHIDTENYIDNLDNLLRLVSVQIRDTDNFTNLVEKGIEYY